MAHRSRRVHSLNDDCEIHIAARPAQTLAMPAAVVVEPPNLCKERAPGMSQQTSETRLRNELWPRYLDEHVMSRTCDVQGYPRIFTEHASGNTDPANPDHVLEIHPALRIMCGTFDLDMRSFLKAYPGMRKIKAQTAARCVDGRFLYVRRRSSRYEFSEGGGGSCGNFALFKTTLVREWIRKIRGGHSAIVRASPGGLGPFTLKIYTYEGTPEDRTVRNVLAGSNVSRRLYYHGMLTYDYFAVLRTVRDRDDAWLGVPEWTRVRFPLAFVVFGEVRAGEEEE